MNAYKKFAYYYDEVIAELDYSLWLEFILPYLNKDSEILDLACGSGTLAIMLKLKGYNVEGLDLSEEIIEIAQEKAKINHLDINFYTLDMTNFNLNKKYDVITCFFDSVNFLSSIGEINKLLQNVKKHLKKDGLFIFDLFSKTLFEEYSKNTIIEDYETFKINWHTNKIDSNILKHDILIQEGDLELKEEYYEYYYEIKSLNLEGFKLLKICGDFNDDLKESDERILIVLQAL